jgi:hypothetical protein
MTPNHLVCVPREKGTGTSATFAALRSLSEPVPISFGLGD